MNVPNLPTDNLYKFMALFGLVLFGFSFYLEFETLESVNDNEYQRNILLNKNSKRIDEHNNTVKITNERNEKLIDKISKLTDSTEYASLIGLITDELIRVEPQIMYLDSISSSLKKELEEENIFIAKSDVEKIRLSNLLALSSNLRWSSVILVLVGFVLWWFKYQRYIDAETKYNGQKNLKLLEELESSQDEEELDTSTQNKGTQLYEESAKNN